MDKNDGVNVADEYIIPLLISRSSPSEYLSALSDSDLMVNPSCGDSSIESIVR